MERFEGSIQLELLKRMRRIRDVELRIAEEYSQGEMRCPVHLSVGQEAPSSALSLLVYPSDYAVSTHRGHAHYLAKGGDLNAMIAEIYGKETGCSKGKGGSMHLIDTTVGFMGTSAIVGNSIPTGTGLAHAAQLNKTGQISIIHLGDGAIEEGSFYESLNYAAVKNLPALYLCENNFYSVYSPLNVRQPKNRDFCFLAKSIGAKTFSGDGNCVISSYKTLKQAVKYCRSGKGPTFVELKTYRWLEHCGPNNDNELGYREEREIEYWMNNDPIKKAEARLRKRPEKDHYKNYCQALKKEVDDAFEFAKLSSAPDIQSRSKTIFSTEQ